MSDAVEQMFSVRETPWHGLGHILSEAPSFEEILPIAGLDWTVSMRDLFMEHNGGYRKVVQRAITRDSDDRVLGFAGPHYTPLQNEEALEFFQPFAESGACSFETGGSLRQGQKIWFLAALNSPEMEVVTGDPVKKFLLLSNSHRGNEGVRVGFTPIRVVCANTLASAHDMESSKLIRVWHTSRVKETLDAVKDIVNLANQTFEATLEQYKELAKKDVRRADIEKYVDIVFYNEKQAETDREKLAREKLNNKILELFETGLGNDLPGVRGTVWALYNGTTQYLNYERGRSQDVRLDSLWFGENRNLSAKALKAALEKM